MKTTPFSKQKLRKVRNPGYRKLLNNAGKSFFLILMSSGMHAFAGDSPGDLSYNVTPGYESRTMFVEVEGTVTDNTGSPLAGVSITVVGSNMGAITDESGHFSLNIPENATIEISLIGYQKQTLKIKNQRQLQITLLPTSSELNEVIVVGYGTQKQKDLTGAITSVSTKDITLNPASDPLASLQGKVPGLDITKSSGQAGAGVAMQLRGNRSLSASGNPLVLIDGMPGSYNTLNPNDIESIDVLRDASSTSIYGSSGANGVILITTKSGKVGKTQIDLNSYVGVNGWSKTPEVYSGDGFFNLRKQALQAGGLYTTDSDVLSAETYAAYQRGENIDWAKAVMNNNLTQNYSLAVSGGTEKTKAYFSLNYNGEDGQYKGDKYNIFSSNIRIDHKLAKWLSAGVNSQMSYSNSNSAYSKMETVLRALPYGQLYNDDGSLRVLPVAGDEKTVNFLLDTDRDVYRNENNNFQLYFNPYIRISPIAGLTLESRVNATLLFSRHNTFIGQGSYQYYFSDGANATGTTPTVAASITPDRTYNYRWENILTYEFNVGEDHQFKFTGVTTYDHDQTDNAYLFNNQFSSNSFLWDNMGVGKNPTVSSSYVMSKGLGLIGRLNYSFKDKYLFQASVRGDGSSRLAEGHQWSTFPSVSAGWRIGEEPFMQSAKAWMPNLKLRAGYGVAGTASIDPYSSVANIESGFYSLSGIKVDKNNYSQLLANPDLTWERSYTTNIGVDADFLGYRIRFTADYYITNTDGVIWTKNIPVVNGAYNASTLYQTRLNIAKTRNTGVELSLNTRNIETQNFHWASTVTFSANKERITKLAEKSSTPVINGDFALKVGYPINSYYNFKILGVWQKGEEDEAAVFGEKPGDLKIDVPNLVQEGKNEYSKTNADGEPVVDADGNKIIYDADNPYAISNNDMQIIGHNSPDWSLGFQNTFTYKNFDLTIYAYLRYGQMIDYPLLTDYDPSANENFATYFNYWTPDNPSNDFPALNAAKQRQDYLGFFGLSYVDGSFIKLKNVTLGYTLPDQSSLRRVGVSRLRFYATATNLFVLSKSHLIKQYDPEQNGSLDFPLTKQLVLGVNLTF